MCPERFKNVTGWPVKRIGSVVGPPFGLVSGPYSGGARFSPFSFWRRAICLAILVIDDLLRHDVRYRFFFLCFDFRRVEIPKHDECATHVVGSRVWFDNFPRRFQWEPVSTPPVVYVIIQSENGDVTEVRVFFEPRMINDLLHVSLVRFGQVFVVIRAFDLFFADYVYQL